MKAALYARFSTDKQSEASIEDQFRVCERLCEREGFTVTARYSDKAISGGTSTRPGYQALLRAARHHEFDAIVAEDSSRLWRELSEQWRALKELQDLGIHVIGHGLDTRREESRILLAVSGAMAEAYRDEIARRTRRGLEGLAVAGKPTGGRAYGYIAARDSGTGRIEINEAEAAIVVRIFMLYADGRSPRSIAALLNAERIASPGSSWNRKSRRTSGWLASAIHGDVTRGTGILNNKRYAGIVIWGRSMWRRGAADSAKRHMSMNSKATHEAIDERLRIVPQELWERVKSRQRQRRSMMNVKGTSRRNAPGQGRPPRYLLSGLLRCGLCGAHYTIADARAYVCASYLNGRACVNNLRISRTLAEMRILESVKTDLRDPLVIAEVERRVTRALADKAKPKADNSSRIAELKAEIGNLVDATASGLLKGSPALAKRLAATEAELERLQAESHPKAPVVARIAPRIAERFLALVDQLEAHLGEDPERSKMALMEAIGDSITLQPDESREFLWAEYGLEGARIMAPIGMPEIMVAGAGFEPATFGL